MTTDSTGHAPGHDLVQRAKVFATETHQRIGHRRKYTDQPYEVHLKAVAQIVKLTGARPEVVAAAWLHDTVEDTPATFQDIEAAFGPDVARLVSEVTDVSRPSDGNRAARKLLDLRHLARASDEGKTIKLADLIDNCRDICRNDPRFAKTYILEMADLLPMLAGGDPTLQRKSADLLRKNAAKLGLVLPELDGAEHPRHQDVGGPTASRRFARHRVERLFARLFTIRDIAEPLRSFDVLRAATEVEAILKTQDLSVAGVRAEGVVIGYVRRADLVAGVCRDHLRRFASDQVMPDDASLTDAIEVLTRHDYAFVSTFDAVSGVLSRADIQKPIVRMWLFGMITLLEMDWVKRIRARWPGGEWAERVPPARLDKARELLSERRRRGQSSDLLDCLQLSDKAQVLFDDPEELAAFGLDTRSNARRVLKDLESLRNNLAHAQDIVTHDWPQVARMTRRVESHEDDGEAVRGIETRQGPDGRTAGAGDRAPGASREAGEASRRRSP